MLPRLIKKKKKKKKKKKYTQVFEQFTYLDAILATSEVILFIIGS